MKQIGVVLLAVAALLLSGCGYRVGSLMHPQIKTIAVAPVVNDTTAYNVAAKVRMLLCECFTKDGTVKLVDQSTADCIVYARVTEIRFSERSWASKRNGKDKDDFFTPNEWQVNLTMEYSVVIPGRAEPLIPTGTVSGWAQFETGPDMQIGRTNGIMQAAYMASQNLVAAVTEGW